MSSCVLPSGGPISVVSVSELNWNVAGEPPKWSLRSSKDILATHPWPVFLPESTTCQYLTQIDFSFEAIVPFNNFL